MVDDDDRVPQFCLSEFLVLNELCEPFPLLLEKVFLIGLDRQQERDGINCLSFSSHTQSPLFSHRNFSNVFCFFNCCAPFFSTKVFYCMYLVVKLVTHANNANVELLSRGTGNRNC